jgi:hypothetical protein
MNGEKKEMEIFIDDPLPFPLHFILHPSSLILSFFSFIL